MNACSFRARLADYILSGHSFLHVPTTETTRFLGELRQLAGALPEDGRQMFTWSHATGWRDGDGKPPESVQNGQPDPQQVAQQILDLPEESIFVLRDFGWYLQHKTYSYADVVIAWLIEIRDVLASSGRTVIFLGPDFDVPAALANDVTTVGFPLPDDQAIEESVRFVMDGHGFDDAVMPQIVSACRGDDPAAGRGSDCTRPAKVQDAQQRGGEAHPAREGRVAAAIRAIEIHRTTH
jgi:hypothetical protein